MYVDIVMSNAFNLNKLFFFLFIFKFCAVYSGITVQCYTLYMQYGLYYNIPRINNLMLIC